MATNLEKVRRGYADLSSGLQMYYETMGKGDPVIFIHQCWWSNFEYERVIPIVAKQYKVYAPDMLGFGNSPRAPWEWEFREYAESFVDFVDAMGIEKASFVGQHTGSAVIADIAARYPDRVDKLILGGLLVYDEDLRREKYARRRMIGWNYGPYVKQIKPGDVIGYEVSILQKKDDGSHLIEMWNEQKRENPDSKIDFVQKAFMANMIHYDKGGADGITMLLNYDLEGTLPKVQAPCLLIAGSRDCIKPPVFKPVSYAGSLISGPVKYEVVYGAGIMGWLDHPLEHAEAVLGFLEDPAAYEGTTGYELELAMKEYLFVVEDKLEP
jgi:pimeloyl-ACP methyl ester carboxylesterase